MKIRRDSNGIPIADSSDIERIAAHFLHVLVPATLVRPQFTPLAEIANSLSERGLCTFSFDEDLGSNARGHKLFGYFAIGRKHIAVDCSLDSDDPRFSFTLAHELGHFYLHGKVKPSALSDSSSVIQDSTREIVTHRIESDNPRSLLEWQANQFAAAILMPRSTTLPALLAIQESLGVTRHAGRVWLDRQRQSQKDYHSTLSGLAGLFRVSKSVVRIRLKEVGVLDEDERYMPRSIKTTLGAILEDMFAENSRAEPV